MKRVGPTCFSQIQTTAKLNSLWTLVVNNKTFGFAKYSLNLVLLVVGIFTN